MTIGGIARGLAITVYWTVTRLVVLGALLVTSLYFVLNMRPFPARLTELLKAALPGTIELSTLQISPVPWEVDLLDVRATTPAGERVATVGSIRVTVDLNPLIAFVLGETPGELQLHFESVRLKDFDAAIEFDPGGKLRFLDAFVFPPEPPAPDEGPSAPGLKVKLTFSRVLGENGACQLSFPEWSVRVEGISLEASLFVGEDGHVRVEAPDLRFLRAVGRIPVAPNVALIPREVFLGAGQVTGFLYDFDRIAFRRVLLTGGDFGLDAWGTLAFPSDRPLAFDGWVDLAFPAGSPTVQVATAGLVVGAVNVHVHGRGDDLDPVFSLDASAPDLVLAGRALGRTAVHVAGGRGPDGSYVFRDLSVEAHPAGGRILLSDGSFAPYGTVELPGPGGTARLEFQDIDVPAVVEALDLPELPRRLPVPTHVTGEVDASVRFGDVVRVGVDAKVHGTLPAHVWGAGREVLLRLLGSATFTPDGPAFDVTEVSLKAGPDSLTARGRLDLGTGTTDARGQVEAELGPILAALGAKGAGTVSLKAVRLFGRLDALEASADLHAAGLRFDPLVVDEVTARLSLHDGTLTARDLSARTPFAGLAASSASLDVGALLTGHRAAARLAVRNLFATGIDLSKLPWVPAGLLRGHGDVDVGELGLRLGAPVASLKGSVRATFPALVVSGKALTDLDLRVSASGGVARVEAASCGIRGGGTVGVTGSVDLSPLRMDLALNAADIPVSTLAGTAKNGPLQGTISLRATVQGAVDDPKLDARIEAANLAYQDVRIGTLAMRTQREAGGDLRLSSDRFVPKLHLDEGSALTWTDGRFTGLVIRIGISHLLPQDLYPRLKARDFWADLTGTLEVRLGFGPEGVLEASLLSPAGGLTLKFLNREIVLVNQAALELGIQKDGAVTVKGLHLVDGERTLEICGEVLDPDGKVNLLARGSVGMYWLRMLKEVFSTARGYVRLAGLPGAVAPLPPGCTAEMAQGDPPMSITGTMTQPTPTGLVTTELLELVLRRMPDAIVIEPDARIRFKAMPSGRVGVEIPTSSWIKGMLGDGAFALWGNAVWSGLVPESGEAHLTGTGLRIVSPGSFYVVADPNVTATFRGFGDPNTAAVKLSGQVLVTDGSYHKNFDVVRKAFSGMAGERVATTEGPSLASLAPWIANTALDVAVTGSRFGVRSRLPVGSTDLDLGIDVQVKGTVGSPELWNRLEIVPGGKVIYEVVRREFEVSHGTIDFRGDPLHPLVDLTARTRVDYRANTTTSALVGSHAPDTGNDAFNEDTVLVTLKVSGEYPDLDISLSSNTTDLDQTDLQYLLLTGMTRQGMAQGGKSGQGFNVNLLTDDVSTVVSKLLLSPFIDAVRFGVSTTGGVNAEVTAHVGARLRFDTQVLQDQGGSRYTAGFQVKLTDRLSLTGRLRTVDGTLLTSQQELRRIFEGKLRYRIPLD